ncbi:MAG: iron ABC transporter permease [Actinomycetota bacterium]|nr:iron ABC transporter permease [Actinomycetota bacterium]
MAFSRDHRELSGPWGLRVAAGSVVALFSIPFGYLIVQNASEADAFWRTISAPEALAPLGGSLLLAVAVSIVATVLGTGAAWITTRTDVPGRRLWRILLPLPLVIPSYIGAFVFLTAFAPGGLLEAMLAPLGVERLRPFHGFWGSFFVLTLFTYPYVFLPAAARLAQLPSSLEESARLLGTSSYKTFWRVVLPQSRGAIGAGTLLVFLYSISDFGVVQLMRYDTLTRVIYATRLFDRSTSLALSLQLGLIAVAVVVLERFVARGTLRADLRRTQRPLQLPLRGPLKPAAFASVATLVTAALIVPIAVLLWWSLRGLKAGTMTAGELLAEVAELAGPVLNTSGAALAAALAAVAVVLPVAYLSVRHRSHLAGGANAVIVGGFALPGLVVALSFVFWVLSAPGLGFLYQTLPLLVLAYVVHFGAQSLRTAQVAVAGIPRNVEDAARSLGAHRWRRLVRVDLPLMRPALLSGAGIVLLSTMKELPATLILAPAGFQTLAMKIWSATESAIFVNASLASLMLILLSGFLTWALVIRGTAVAP